MVLVWSPACDLLSHHFFKILTSTSVDLFTTLNEKSSDQPEKDIKHSTATAPGKTVSLMASFPNAYTHRKVANNASKSCEICYKPSTSVLVAPENKDFFFICPGHLKDSGFCSPIIDEAAVAARKKQEMEAEVQRVKQEFEEKQKKKKEKEKEKEKEQLKDKDKDDKEEEKSDEKKKPDEVQAAPEEEPRNFALKKSFYQQRIDKKRNAEIARRNHERLQNPNLFPQVPKGLP